MTCPMVRPSFPTGGWRLAGLFLLCATIQSRTFCSPIDHATESSLFGVTLGDSLDRLLVAYPHAEPVPGETETDVQAYIVKVKHPPALPHTRSAELRFAIASGRVTYIEAELHGVTSYPELLDYLEGRLGKAPLIRTSRYNGWFGTRYCLTAAGWECEHGQAVWVEHGIWRRGPILSVEKYGP